MQIQQVISILDSVAAGVDPHTGQPLPHDLFQSPEVIPAFAAAAEILRSGGTRRPRPQAAGARWTDEEDARLATEFDGGTSVAEIARLHGRTPGAINSRLVTLGKIDPETVNVRERVRASVSN